MNEFQVILSTIDIQFQICKPARRKEGDNSCQDLRFYDCRFHSNQEQKVQKPFTYFNSWELLPKTEKKALDPEISSKLLVSTILVNY